MENKELKKFEDKYMIKVKGGKYKPSFTDEEKEVFDIEVCKYPTTQKMWLEVMKNNPSEFKGDNKPIETVTWWKALEFCNKLSKKYGLEPVYDLSKSNQDKLMIKELGGKIVSPDIANFKNTEGFRLPTEIEWEWFARGGQTAIEQETFDYEYSGSNNVDEVAWYNENSGRKSSNYSGGSTQDVGLKKPNQLGIFDCSSNVWEWCYDTTENIENGSSYVYKAFDFSNTFRRVKGGSWYYFGVDCIVLRHPGSMSVGAFDHTGFRIVRTI